jgi:hypothetical protein
VTTAVNRTQAMVRPDPPQVSGALLSIVFFLVLLQLSGARSTLAGSATVTGCALLLSVVVIEAALLEAVPVAAANGDQATVANAFALSCGVLARVFVNDQVVCGGIQGESGEGRRVGRPGADAVVAVGG